MQNHYQAGPKRRSQRVRYRENWDGPYAYDHGVRDRVERIHARQKAQACSMGNRVWVGPMASVFLMVSALVVMASAFCVFAAGLIFLTRLAG